MIKSMLLLDLPFEIFDIIVESLDKYTQSSLLTTCKYVYVNYKSKCDGAISSLIEEHKKILRIRSNINRIITRNIFIELYNLHGECEQCNKVGFLFETDRTTYPYDYSLLTTKCICLEKCRIICQYCEHFTYILSTSSTKYSFINKHCDNCNKNIYMEYL